MSLVWQCDRCRRISGIGDVDDPPEDWHRMDMPCRGSQGAKSRQTLVLCEGCDDDLYGWLQNVTSDEVLRRAGSASSKERQG